MDERSKVDTRREAHIRLLQEIDHSPLSCCEICRCDCYNLHNGSPETISTTRCGERGDNSICHLDPETTSPGHRKSHKKKTRTTKESRAKKSDSKTRRKHDTACGQAAECEKPRSKSACSYRSGQRPTSPLGFLSKRCMRDCEILQSLLVNLDENPQLQIKPSSKSDGQQKKWTSMCNISKESKDLSLDSPQKLCASMANLCLKKTVREAYQKVPVHDKKILNRMASKRSEKILAKETAWLARKYWENERYERELFKCEQMEGYKRALRDKQFQDYLMAKARLNELAERDLAELQRLRHTVEDKDARAKKRINALRSKRDFQLCQRRCEELRKAEAVNVHQNEQELEESIRRDDLCNRLTERIHRANLTRAAMLDSYLKRLRNDNYLESLMHEEKWRETQEMELARREQLKEHISRKRTRSQRFVELRQRHNAAITKTAKISRDLRQLVRDFTPESLAVENLGGSTMSLSRLMTHKPIPRLDL